MSIMRRAVSRLVAIGFCTWMCFFASAQHCDGFQAEFGEGAHVDVVDARMPAQVLESRERTRSRSARRMRGRCRRGKSVQATTS